MSRHDSADVEVREKKQELRIRYGLGSVLFRTLVLLCSAGGFLIFLGLWSYSDDHNDKRYVKREEYAGDTKLADANLSKQIAELKDAIKALRELREEDRKWRDNVDALLRQILNK